MFNKKTTWILGGITTSLVIAVLVLGYWQNQQANRDVSFLRMQKSPQQENRLGKIPDKPKTKPSVSVQESRPFTKLNLDQIKNRETKLASVSEPFNDLNVNIQEQTPLNQIKEVSEIEAIPFEKLEFSVDWLPFGESEITVKGVNGRANVLYQEVYQNGHLIKRIEKSREIIENPIREEIAVGEKEDFISADNTKPGATDVPQLPNPSTDNTNTNTSTNTDINTNTGADTNTSTHAETNPSTPAGGLAFVTPGSNQSAFTNLNLISPLLNPNGLATYSSFTVNADQTITVDGMTFAYDSSYTSTLVTGYDGALLNSYMTASGLPTQRGIVASCFPQYGGLPIGTVLFVEGYGLVVVADRNGMGHIDSTALDICFNNGELIDGSLSPGNSSRQVYILSTD